MDQEDMTAKDRKKDVTEEQNPDSKSPDPVSDELDAVEQAGEEAGEDRLQTLQEEKETLYDRLLRERASFENYRKRVEREKLELADYARGEVLNEILAVYDNFERAMEHMDSKDPKKLREGVALIYKQLGETLAKLGVKPVDGAGTVFDPRVHEAISREETSEMPDGAVLRVFQKGYLLKEKLLRPAKVIVATNKNSEGETEVEPE